MGYRLTPHTADLGLVAWGETLEVAFTEAVRALVAVTYDPRTLRQDEARELRVDGDRPEQLLVRLLGEVVYLIDAQGFVTARAGVQLGEGGLTAELRGQVAGPRRPRRRGPHVKAVTYHGLAVDPGPPARVRVVLDV